LVLATCATLLGRQEHSNLGERTAKKDVSLGYFIFMTWDLAHNGIFLFSSLFFNISHDFAGVLRQAGSFHPILPVRFFQRCSLAVRWSTWPSVGAPFFLKGTPLPPVGASFFTAAISHLILFLHNSCTHPPFHPLLLTTMPHGSRSVTTSHDCVGAPTVAALCESDCIIACVVQSERKKKRVSVIVGTNRKVPKFKATAKDRFTT
jgi:hypothetical protein